MYNIEIINEVALSQMDNNSEETVVYHTECDAWIDAHGDASSC